MKLIKCARMKEKNVKIRRDANLAIGKLRNLRNGKVIRREVI
ncbi:MAG: hypothetical protein QXR27_01250 [Archaeoglobaceae archaeon]